MNIPSLPTDNLYKFMAIFGLIIFVLGIYFIQIFDEDVIQATIEERLSDRSKSRDSLIYAFYFNRFDRQLEKHDLEREVHPERHDDTELIEGFEELEKYFDTYSNSADKNVRDYGRLDYIMSQQKRYRLYSLIMMNAGAILIVLGFAFWYKKHQIYVDAERRWKGVIYVEKLRKKQQEEEVKKELGTNNQEPDTETESDS